MPVTLFRTVAAAASTAAAGASAAPAAPAVGTGFDQGAYCQKYDSGQYGQYDDITHDSYLLWKILHFIDGKTTQAFALFRLVALAQGQVQKTCQHDDRSHSE